MSERIRAVIFDLDGVLVDSEQVWDAARRQLAEESGGHWSESATQDMMGMSSTEWSRYMHEELGVKMPPEEISAAVVRRMERLYREHLPLIPGAHEAVERVAARWPLGLASSANRPVIEMVLELSGLGDFFETTVSSEEVAHGKPAPDVYLEAAWRLRVDPALCVAVEDSGSGILSAHVAGMRVVAIPNRTFPPSEEALNVADAEIPSLRELHQEVIDSGA
ncbi:MAG: HAD family phosphatase [Rubrobacter sp.]|nr:HAD family phosphatase [Rubrobacter sp.]